MKHILRKRWGLTLSLVSFVFAVMMAAMILAGIILVVLHYAGVVALFENAKPEHPGGGLRVVVAMAFISVLLGTTLATYFSRVALNPIRKVVDATRRVAEGDYGVRVDVEGVPELEELSRAFNKMAHELSSIETLRSDFINSFSHEFKTPIVSIRGFARLLKDERLAEGERQGYLDIIIAESERLASLSTNVLNLSRYDHTEIIPDKATFRLDEQIRRVLIMTEPKWTAKEIALDVQMEDLLFEANEDFTQQIWLNLVDNAIKFSHCGGTVTIRLNAWNSGALFTIEDNGIGMDAETASRIFERFYQGGNAHERTGNGLGLAIVRRIVNLSGGSITVQSEPGQGSTFRVFLPGPG